MKKEITVKLKYLKISPRKVRLVADLIRKLPVNEAEAQLFILPNRSAKPILKLLRSAVESFLKQKQAKYEHLWIKEIKVDEGPMLKRYRIRARGSVNEIHKKSSHITLTLEEKKESFSKYKFIKKEKKKKKAAEKKAGKENEEKREVLPQKEKKEKKIISKEEKEKENMKPKKIKENKRFFKIFRRKTGV